MAAAAVLLAGVTWSVNRALRRRVLERTEALAASEARFRALAEASPVGIFQADLQGACAYLNPAAERMLGQPYSQAAGDGWQGALHPDDLDGFLQAWRGAVQAGRGLSREVRALHPGGRQLQAQVLASPIRSAAGQVTGFVGIIADLTESLALQEQLDIASRHAALGTLVAGVTHEINNPLAAALASHHFAEKAVRSVRDGLAAAGTADGAAQARTLDEVLEALADASTGEERVAEIVKAMAQFARPQAVRDQVPVEQAVALAVRWLPRAVIDRASIETAIEDRRSVRGSEKQVAAVLVSLLSNAAQAMPAERTGTIRIRVAPGADGMVLLEVADDGRGMDAEVLRRVFDPFFSTRQVGGGLGMGLAVTRSIVTSLGGTISATSAPGVGSTFRVELPAAA